MRFITTVFLMLLITSVYVHAQTDIPTDWVDPDTGHRIVRLSCEDGSRSSYFHQNEFTPDGRKLIFTTPSGLYTVDLQSREIEQIRDKRTWLICVGRKTGRAFYLSRGDEGFAIWAVDPATKEDRKVVDVPRGLSIANINCDETLAGGTFDLNPPQRFGGRRSGRRPGFGTSNKDRDMQLVTIDLKTGRVNKFNESHAWLNHVQFSPTDPNQMLFCHEGTWQLMDRTWIIRTDGSGLSNVQPRIMNYQINGHEFFSPDGKSIIYDLQTPRSHVFWVGCYEIESQKRTWYNLQKNEWSVHFNISPDQKLFCGDGGGPRSVAAPDNGQWIYLFHPHVILPVTGGASDPNTLIRSGYFEAEKLVNLAKHNYSLEPNCQFTPDGKWIVFRSNMFGPAHIYMVEIAKSTAAQP
jgi:oligogalacturonide lyase